MLLDRIDQMRKVNWGKSYQWEILLDDTPPPFRNNFFPATDVKEDLAALNSHTFDGYLSNYKVPLNSQALTVEITFVDDYLGSLKRWFTEWINDIILGEPNRYQYVAMLSDAVKKMTIMEYIYSFESGIVNKNWVRLAVYDVYPEGTISYAGTSEANVPTYSLSFNIVRIRNIVYNNRVMKEYTSETQE